jgi:CRP-like cAMP-binding protein
MQAPPPDSVLNGHLDVSTLDSRTASAGDRIDAGGGVVVLRAGAAARIAPGSSFLGVIGAGDALGLESLDEGAVWLSAGRYVVLPQGLLDTVPAEVRLECALLDLRRKLEAVRKRLCDDRRPLRARVARLLNDIQVRAGEAEIRLRQSDLAELLQVRRAGVSDACRSLEAEGMIRIRRNRIVVLDPSRLARED